DVYYDFVADGVDDRRIFDVQAIDQLHQHFGRPGFAAVQPAHQMIDRFRLGDDLPRLVFGDLARVGELGEVAAIGLDVFDRLFIGDDHDQTLAPFVRLSDVERLD